MWKTKRKGPDGVGTGLPQAVIPDELGQTRTYLLDLSETYPRAYWLAAAIVGFAMDGWKEQPPLPFDGQVPRIEPKPDIIEDEPRCILFLFCK